MKKSELYCDRHPEDVANCGATDDASTACTSSTQCASPLPACDLGAGQCVQCTTAEPAACTGTTPVCEGTRCAACTRHEQCPSSVCLPDGSCADAASVAFVDAMGTENPDCSRATPCTKLSRGLATARPVIKVSGTVDEQVTINNQNVEIVGGTSGRLTYTGGNGFLLRIDGSSVVTIVDLELTGATGSLGHGLTVQNSTGDVTLRRVRIADNGGSGVSAIGGKLTVTQSTIYGNYGGGISIGMAEFDLTNNFIVANGTGTSTFGGVRIDSIPMGLTGRLEFNTITENNGTAGSTTGVLCTSVFTPLIFSNNIVYENVGTSGRMQTAGPNCSWTYSDIGPGTSVSGTGNMNVDPEFKNTIAHDYHLMPTSMVKDKADASATMAIDVDGEQRPMGSGRDLGADEAP